MFAKRRMVAVAALGMAACAVEAPSSRLDADDVEYDQSTVLSAGDCDDSEICRTAKEAYIYGYPLMLMEYTKRALLRQPGGQINRFLHRFTRPDPSDRAVVRPNHDTLYSVAFLDLRDGPQILDVPALQDRFYLLQLLDGWTTSLPGSPGSANTGTSAQSFAVVGPDHTGSVEGVSATYRMETNMVWILGRTRIVEGLRDHLEVLRAQRGYCLRPVDDYRNDDRSNCERSITVADGGKALLGMLLPELPTPPELVHDMDMGRFLRKLAVLMADNPGYRADQEVLARFEDVLGFVPGEPYWPSLREWLEMRPARRAALGEMHREAGVLGVSSDGWNLIVRDIGEYGDDYLRRAAVALAGFGANRPEDAIYPTALKAGARELEGDGRYRLRFASPPPVRDDADGFWSVSLYDGDGYFIDNDEEQYVVHSWQVDPAPEAPIDIYLGCTRRSDFGDRMAANDFWLPGGGSQSLQVTLRMYAPAGEALMPPPEAGGPAWKPPAIEYLGRCGSDPSP